MKLHLFHGLNLRPEAMLPLGRALSENPVVHSLKDHANCNINSESANHWQRWNDDADQWVTQLDSDSVVLSYSISAPLLINALKKANKTVNKMILLSPAFYFKKSFTIVGCYLNFLPNGFLIPSFNKKTERCNFGLPLGLYRSIKDNLNVPTSFQARSSIVLIHPGDELLQSKPTLKLAKQCAAKTVVLSSPRLPPYHASYKASCAPIDILREFMKSDT
tara:strand:+ start:4215 stop:4871 length:657 start_codon:yes stop_codon:yes gene_type:complete